MIPHSLSCLHLRMSSRPSPKFGVWISQEYVLLTVVM